MEFITFVIPSGGRCGGINATIKVANLLLEKNYIVRILVKKRKSFDFKNKARDFYFKNKYSGTVEWLDEFKGAVFYYDNLSAYPFEKGEFIVFVGLETIDEIGNITSKNVTKVFFIHGLILSRPDLIKKASFLNIPKLYVSSYLENIFNNTLRNDFSAIIHNGVDLNEYYPVFQQRERNGIGTIYSGATSKDPETIIKVIEVLKNKLPYVPIYTFGSWKKPKDLKNVKYIRLPSIELSRDIYSACRVWFVASKTEGFSLPILEAMACGCAVVSTKCGGPSDIVNNGENGYLVDVGDAEDLSEKILEIYSDNNKYDMFKFNAFKTVKYFSWEKSANLFEEALKNIKHLNR